MYAVVPIQAYNLVSEPLEKGTQVKVLAKNQQWVEVEYSMKGWVNQSYLDVVKK